MFLMLTLSLLVLVVGSSYALHKEQMRYVRSRPATQQAQGQANAALPPAVPAGRVGA